MDCMAFVASIIRSLAWPVAAVVLVLLLKEEIVKVVPLLKRIKAGPVEADFEREVKELKLATPPPVTPTATKPEDSISKDFLFQLAELHPRSAILESWVRVEAAARAALSNKVPSVQKGGYIPAARLAEPLAQAEIIAQGQVTLYHELRRLRNEVAHAVGFEPTQESARAYIDLASFLQSDLEGSAK